MIVKGWGVLKSLFVYGDEDSSKELSLTVHSDASSNTTTELVSKSTQNRTIRLPDADTTLVGNDSPDSLTNKQRVEVGNLIIEDNKVETVVGEYLSISPNTKIVELDGNKATNISPRSSNSDELDLLDKGYVDTITDDMLSGIEDDSSPTLSADLDAGNNKIINLSAPTNGSDITTKKYVDDKDNWPYYIGVIDQSTPNTELPNASVDKDVYTSFTFRYYLSDGTDAAVGRLKAYYNPTNDVWQAGGEISTGSTLPVNFDVNSSGNVVYTIPAATSFNIRYRVTVL